jgi:hypothetical protein
MRHHLSVIARVKNLIVEASGQGADHVAIAASMIERLRKRQRRRLTIIGVMVHDKDAAAAALRIATQGR